MLRMNLKLVGRNYFDPEAKVVMNKYKLELWPGYDTSIRQHENDILLCCEVTHKVLSSAAEKLNLPGYLIFSLIPAC